MDQVTQRNAAMVEETSAATHKLSAETQNLVALVGRFRLGNDIAAAPSYAAAPSRPAAATSRSAPVSSPARKMMGSVAKAFNGSAAVAQVKDDWQEF